jgi:Na+/phosphate symporter
MLSTFGRLVAFYHKQEATMATMILPLALAIVGALVYAFAKDKVAELGRIAFFAGILALAFQLSTYKFSL